MKIEKEVVHVNAMWVAGTPSFDDELVARELMFISVPNLPYV